MGASREPAYFTYFKGAESKKTGSQAKFLDFDLLICISKWPPNCLSCSVVGPFSPSFFVSRQSR